MALTIPPVLSQLLQGALSGASAEAVNAFEKARKGTLKMMLVFQDPDGKVLHFRLGMSKDEAAAVCKIVFRQIKEEATK